MISYWVFALKKVMEYQARQIIYGLLPSDLIAHSV